MAITSREQKKRIFLFVYFIVNDNHDSRELKRFVNFNHEIFFIAVNGDHKNKIDGYSDFNHEINGRFHSLNLFFFLILLCDFLWKYENRSIKHHSGLGFLVENLLFYSIIMYGMLHKRRQNFLNSFILFF